VRVNAIAPGLVDTKFASALTSNDEIKSVVLSRMATKEIAEPEDIAGLALLLASDRSRYMTGECVVIDGGWTIG
jgi:NAD(P)-dependent dehydrogenase (short-subunit alcohol dehydrogenase family)